MQNVNFISIANRRRYQLALSGFTAAFSAALGLMPYAAIYLITAHLFDKGVDDADFNYVMIIAGASLVAALGKVITNATALHISHVAAYDILYEIRMEIARKLGTLPLGYFDYKNTGAIKRVIHEDVEKMEVGLAHIVPDLTSAMTVPVLSFIVLLFIDWRLALVLLISPILGTILSGVMSAMMGMSEGMRRYYTILDRMNSTVIQYINGMKVIKTFMRAQASFADFKSSVDEMVAFYVSMGKNMQRVWAGVPVTFRTGPLFVLPAGLLLHAHDLIDLPTLLLFLVMSLGFARPIYNLLMNSMMTFYQIHTSMIRIDGILAEASLAEPEAPQQPSTYDVTFHDVSFHYGGAALDDDDRAPIQVLNGVSFSVPQGTVTALVGPSGAGKTTIARLIPRFWDVIAGRIEIGGVDIRQMSTTALMDTVSFVFQDVFLFNDSIYENIRVGSPGATREQVIAAAKLAYCHDFIEELGGYDYQVGENGEKLSGGQRQRISIARAILKNAPIIVLDEATAFVDPENENLIQEAIAALLNSTPGEPKTLIVVAHRLSTITEVDQILLVDAGQIADAGTHDELLASSPLYQTLWQAHTDASVWQFDTDASVETITINRNTAYDGEDNPLDNPFAGLVTAKGHWQRINALVTNQRNMFRRGVLLSVFEGSFIAIPITIIYLALIGLHRDNISTAGAIALSVGLLVIFAGQYLFSFLSYITYLRADTGMQRDLRLFLGDYLRRLPLGFFTNRDVGYIDALFTTTIDFIETRISTSLFVSSVVAPMLIFFFTLFIDWRMAMAMAIGVPVAAWVLRRTTVIFDEVWHTVREARNQANSRMVEYIQGIGVIRAFNLPGERLDQFAQSIDHFRLASIETITRLTPAMIGFVSVLEIGFALMLLLGGWLTVEGMLSFEKFLVMMLAGTSFFAPLMMLGEMMAFQRIIANGVRNINEFLKSPVLPQPQNGQKPAGYAIGFNDVHFSYAEEKVLNGVSFDIPENAMVALVGPSGSGKTTITNLIARFWDVDQGSVMVGGVDVRDITSDDLLSKITMVFQDVYLFNDTVMNNIRFANPAATDEQVHAAARLAQAHDFVTALPNGYDTMVGEGGSTLSGGEKQRISIARAILKDAPIVLLDEATASIDPENERLIQQAFNALVKNKTVIIIAHRLSTVQTADLILVLDDGQVIQQGTHDDLINQPGMYQRFWEERQKSRSWKLGRAAAHEWVQSLAMNDPVPTV